MCVVDIEQGVVVTGDARELVQIGRVPGHAVDAVHADQPSRRPVLPQEPLEIVRILEAEALDGRPAGGCELAAVVNRLVRAVVDEDRSVPGEDGDDGQVDQRDRGDDERVFAAEELDQALLDLGIEHGAAEHARPARMRPPLLEVLGDGIDDLAVEVEAEVVAGGEVRQPLVADADHPTVDLVDDRIGHGVGPLELGELAARSQPAIDPARRCRRSAVGSRPVHSRPFLAEPRGESRGRRRRRRRLAELCRSLALSSDHVRSSASRVRKASFGTDVVRRSACAPPSKGGSASARASRIERED